MKPPDYRPAATCANCRNAKSRWRFTPFCLKYSQTVESDYLCAGWEAEPE